MPRNNESLSLKDEMFTLTKTTRPELQRKRKKVREVIKKNSVQLPYPAQFKALSGGWHKTVPLTMGSAAKVERAWY